jgi:cytochrome c oxidase subunit 2
MYFASQPSGKGTDYKMRKEIKNYLAYGQRPQKIETISTYIPFILYFITIFPSLIGTFNSAPVVPFLGIVYLDIPRDFEFGFQDPSTPAAIAIQDLHWHIMTILLDVFIFVSTLLIITLYIYRSNNPSLTATKPKHPSEETTLHRAEEGEKDTSGSSIRPKEGKKEESFNESAAYELLVTALSSILLLFIGIPGLAALYALDEALTPVLNIKVIGKQWQWSYEYSDYTNLNTGKTLILDSAPILAFDSTLNPYYNLLSVDNNLVVPANVPINFVITSTDVIHSWAVPSAGIKMDAVPGRLNSFTTIFNRIGTFYGQCSELCGQGHSLMPICVKAVSLNTYEDFLKTNLKELE